MSFPTNRTATIERHGDQFSVTIRNNGKFVSSTVHPTREKAVEYAASRKAKVNA